MIIRLAAILFFVCLSASAKQFQLRDGDVVAFVGGTDLVRVQKDGRLEAAITHRFKGLNLKFRDLAWDADTVYFQSTVRERWRPQAFGGWGDQLKKIRATVVIVQFGKIESLEGENKLEDFLLAYNKLLDEMQGGGRTVVVLGPSAFEWDSVKALSIAKYTESIRFMAKERDLLFVKDNFEKVLGNVPPSELVKSVKEKHRLWYDYWRPANWKCLFGDDSRRIFSNAAVGLPSFKQEWERFPELIKEAEKNIAAGKKIKPKSPPQRTGSNDADLKKELASFDVLDGFEVNLFADESEGVTNPLSVRWDTKGRMFVACSDVYPQIEPGVMPDDKIIMLTDINEDGRADKSEVFARGLNIPTGMEVGAEGVYVGQNTELLFLDWKGGRKVLLSGFGNGDSHQTVNSFAWSPGGELWFCQGDGIESRVETPFGVSSLFQAGVFRLRPNELKLDGLLDDFMGPGNPWGVAFDDFGQSFVIDGAGGVSYLTPGSIPAKRRLRLPRIGRPGGYCGIDCLGMSNLPENMGGDFVIGDYKKNQVSRFSVSSHGAGFKVNWREPLLRSSHRNFRPIDVKVGPDGAIYIVDWYNPITCHQDDFYRHPDRDKTHGRIWRVSPKNGAVKIPRLADAPLSELVDQLASKERWTRLKAKQVLSTRKPSDVIPVLRDWASGREGLDLLEAVSALEYLESPEPTIIGKLIQSEDFRGRAYAARVVGRWGKRLEGAQQLLLKAASDKHPRVRMEALLACADIPDPRSVLIAAAAAEMPRDQWIDYAFAQSVFHLKPHWVPAFRSGDLDFEGYQRGLAAVLGQADSKAILEDIRDLLKKGNVKGETKLNLARALVMAGDEKDLMFALNIKPASAPLLIALGSRSRPDFEVAGMLSSALKSKNTETGTAAIHLAGKWEVNELQAEVSLVAIDSRSDKSLRSAAIESLGRFGGDRAAQLVNKIADNSEDPCQLIALKALLQINTSMGVKSALLILQTDLELHFLSDLFEAVGSREGALRELAKGLERSSVSREQGELMRQAWITKGLISPAMSSRLDALAKVPSPNIEYSDSTVRELVSAGQTGDVKKGLALFGSARLACAACHKVGDSGGAIGPDLSAVGGGVPFERIVTEVLWPTLQIKEGYSLTRVVTKEGQSLQGYKQVSRDKDVLLLRDFASGKMHRVPGENIAKNEPIGSLMPPTAQFLSKEEIGDLLAYLFGLRGG